MIGPPALYTLLQQLNIPFDYIEHPPLPTLATAQHYLHGHDVNLCKNLFFRNHKGNRHYLVILAGDSSMDIHAIEHRLHEGKLTFASPHRMQHYLGVAPGSVTPFGLIHDTEHHVRLFLDQNLRHTPRLSFHPCLNTASLTLAREDLLRFIDHLGNAYEWLGLY
ncbi:prolyl-tRNA editing protein [Tannerella sp. oral taxon 808]|nr:prolyl-tRNA editing protein [Tannerella sp. oral taxon 808]